MKTYVRWAVCSLYLAAAAFCDAASFTPVPVTCGDVEGFAITNLDQRMEVPGSGFSVLPPQGEHWCAKSLASRGFSFLKAPVVMPVFGQPSSSDQLFPAALQAVRFTGFAVDFPDLGFNIESPEQLKVAVDEMISTHIFSQFMAGIISAERRYQLLEFHSALNRSLGASCVRFDAKVEARGFHKALPGMVVVLSFINNLICAHPHPQSSESPLIWVSFVEAY